MNDRNVAALTNALRGAPGLPAGASLEALARHLATAGVLYRPSAPAGGTTSSWSGADPRDGVGASLRTRSCSCAAAAIGRGRRDA